MHVAHRHDAPHACCRILHTAPCLQMGAGTMSPATLLQMWCEAGLGSCHRHVNPNHG